MKIEGCKRKDKHLFLGKKKDSGKEEALMEVRYGEIMRSRHGVHR